MCYVRGVKLLLLSATFCGVEALQQRQHPIKNLELPLGKPRRDSNPERGPSTGIRHKATKPEKNSVNHGDDEVLKDSAFVMDSAGTLRVEPTLDSAKADSALRSDGANDLKVSASSAGNLEVVINPTSVVTDSIGSFHTPLLHHAKDVLHSKTSTANAKPDTDIAAAPTSFVTDAAGSSHTTNLGALDMKAEVEHESIGAASVPPGAVPGAPTSGDTPPSVADAAKSQQATTDALHNAAAAGKAFPAGGSSAEVAHAATSTESQSVHHHHAAASSLSEANNDNASAFRRDIGEVLVVVGFASTLFLCAAVCFYHLYQQSKASVTVQSNRSHRPQRMGTK